MEGEVPEIVPSSRKFDLEHPRTLFRIDLKSEAGISEAILLTVVHSRKKVGRKGSNSNMPAVPMIYS